MKSSRITLRSAVWLGIWIALATGHGTTLAESPRILEVGAFSTEKPDAGLPAHWAPLHFKDITRHTNYRLVNSDGRTVIAAKADASASGLIRKISIDPKEHPIIRWRWKVSNVLQKGNVHQKAGDDYPARLYILFEHDPDKLSFFDKLKYEAAKLFYGEYPPLASISYIWASNAPEGLMVPNAYTDRAMMFIVESGEAKVNRWVDEERDLYADYREAFKDEPPMISGVAIMTDTDDTSESATAYYGDILFCHARP
ncbi:MAG: DUF3047 domain-containing protein [Deltaproteobacteria bacterium]|nr:DUF3047 domain-containing protein [Deltaproteobacteria bacterium]